MATDRAETVIQVDGKTAQINVTGQGPQVVGDTVTVDVSVEVVAVGTYDTAVPFDILRVQPNDIVEVVDSVTVTPGETVSETVPFDGDTDRESYAVEAQYANITDFSTPVLQRRLSVSLPASELPPESAVGLPDDAVTDLFLDLDGDAVAVGESVPLLLSARLADGTFTDSVPDARYESADRDIVTVDSDGVVTGVSPGVGDIVASVQTPQGRVATDLRVNVEQRQQIRTPPAQPPEADTVLFPFSIFNAVPGIEGAEDFTVRIPQIGDIEQSLVRIVPSISDIDRIVSGEIRSLDIPDPLDTSAVEASVSRVLGDFDVPSLPAVTRTIDAELRQLDIPEPPTVDEILDPIDETLSGVQQDLETAIDELLTDIDQSIAAVDRFVQDSIDSLQTTVDSVSADIESLTADIDETFTDVQETLTEIEAKVPTLDEIVSDVTDSVIAEIEAEIIPAADGVLLTEDVPQFLTITVEDFLQQSLSAETQQNLDDVAQRVSQDV
jgi:hypothetical protein